LCGRIVGTRNPPRASVRPGIHPIVSIRRTIPVNVKRIRAAIRAHGLSRHELIETLQLEAPGQVVVRKKRAYSVVMRGAKPTLVVAPVVHLQRPGKPAPSPAE
jgi:hypothetical protein